MLHITVVWEYLLQSEKLFLFYFLKFTKMTRNTYLIVSYAFMCLALTAFYFKLFLLLIVILIFATAMEIYYFNGLTKEGRGRFLRHKMLSFLTAGIILVLVLLIL